MDATKHRKLLKIVSSRCPLAYEQIFGRKFHVPAERQADYGNFDLDNWMNFERLYAWATGSWNVKDEVANCALWNLCASMHFNRPTLYLERELGEALLRTDILDNVTTDDIRWRWPAFRVVLPKNLISIERPTGVLYLTHFDVSHADPETPFTCPTTIAKEVDQLALGSAEIDQLIKITGDEPQLLEKAKFYYKPDEAGIGMNGALNEPECIGVHQTIYGMAKPWGTMLKLSECHGIEGDLSSPIKRDEADHVLLKRMEHLVMNVLLFLSAEPVVYEPEKVLRRVRHGELQPALVEARFVGKSQYHFTATSQNVRGLPSGTKAAHWTCGSWRRVPHGPKHSLRRVQWIKPYATGFLRQNVGAN